MRSFISMEAFRVNVIAKACLTVRGSSARSKSLRKAKTRLWVLPEPAEALYTNKFPVVIEPILIFKGKFAS